MLPTRIAVAVLAAAASLATAAAVAGPADAAKKPSCKPEKEQKGCTLKSGARYSGTLTGGGGIDVSVDASEWEVSVFPNATGADPCRGRTTDGTSISFKGRPKVGSTYAIKATQNLNARSGLRGTKTVDGKVTITSAKKAEFTGTYSRTGTFRNDPPKVCERSLKTTAKRQ